MSLSFSLSPASDTPIYRQITQHIRRAIRLNQLQPGEQLPAVRILAESLVINPNTVARAYQELIRDAVLESRNGVGVFVARAQHEVFSDSERQRRLDLALEQVVHEAIMLSFTLPQIQASLDEQWKKLLLKPDNRSES